MVGGGAGDVGCGMDMNNEEMGDGQPGVTRKPELGPDATPEQRRKARQTDQIRQMERLMHGAVAFARQQS